MPGVEQAGRAHCRASSVEPRAHLFDVAGERHAAPARRRRIGVGISVAVPGTGSATPTARRQSSNASSTSASQNSMRTGRRRGPLR